MKKVLLTAILLSFFTGAFAQTSDAEAEAIVNLLGVQKRELISKLVAISPSDSAAFWKVYSDYEEMNKVRAKNRLQLYESTVRAYTTMTPALADSLAKKYFNNRVEQEKSLELYYNKIKTATNATMAFEFYQAEIFILTQLRASIMGQIPTYGEFVKAAKKN